MSYTVQSLQGRSSVSLASQTASFPIGGTITDLATAGQMAIPFRTSQVTARKMLLLVPQNDRATSTLTIRQEFIASSLTISIGSSATGEFEDASDTALNTDGWKLEGRMVVGAGGTVFMETAFRLLLDLIGWNARAWHRATCVGVAVLSAAGGSTYYPSGGNGSSATEGDMKWTVRAIPGMGYTAQNFAATVTANTRSDATTISSRKNGAAGALSVSVTSSTNGLFEDTSHTETLAEGDTFNYIATLGAGTGSVTTVCISCELQGTVGAMYVYNTSCNLVPFPAGAAQRYGNLCGTTGTGGAPESDVATKVAAPFTLSHMETVVASNTLTAASTITVRKNNANGNQSISVGSGASGTFFDDLHTDHFEVGDYANYTTVIGGTGTQMVLGIACAFVVVSGEQGSGFGNIAQGVKADDGMSTGNA